MITQYFLDRGLKLCHAKGKAPFEKNWQNEPIKKWNGKDNLGLIHKLNGTCAVDLDDLELCRVAFQSIGIDIDTIISQGVKVIGNPDNRAKAIFRLPPDCPDLPTVGLTWTGKKHLFELRSGHGSQDIIWGTHPSGSNYRIEGDIFNPPILPDELFNVWQNWGTAKPVLISADPNWEPPKQQPKGQTKDRGESVIDRFNATISPFQLLMDNGYTLHGDRLLNPWSSSKIPSVKMFDNGTKFYSWSFSCPFGDGKPHDAFDVFTYFEHNGDTKAAVRAAAELLGMQNNRAIDKVPDIEFDISTYRPGIDPMPQVNQAEFTPIKRDSANPNPPGQIVQDLIEWLGQSNGSTPQYALTQSALSFLSAMFSRRYAFDARSPINLYLGVHCDSVAQLSSMIAILRQATAACGERKIIRADAFSSGAYLKKALNTSARLYWITGEYASAMTFAAKQNNSRGYDSAANTIRDIYSGNQIFIDAEAWGTNKDPLDIFQPAMSILGLMATGEIHKLTNKAEYNRGTLQQLFLIEGGPTINNRQIDSDMPQHLIDFFKQAKPRSGDIASMESPGLKPDLLMIESNITWSDYDRDFDAIYKEYPAWAGVVLGWKKIFKRICGVLAVAQDLNRPIVTPDIAEWSSAWVTYHLMRYMEHLEILGTEQGDLDVSQRVQDLIYRSGANGITERELKRSCRPYRRLTDEERAKLHADLLEDGIRLIPRGNSERYFSSNFLEVTQCKE